MTIQKLGDRLMVVYGPPGTGKTTRLLELLETELEHLPPEQIAFVTFTRAARKEARDRALVKFDLSPEQLVWFRTLHSTGLAMLGTSDKLFNSTRLKEFCERYSYDLTSKREENDGDALGMPPMQTNDDDLRSVHEWGRHRLLTVHEAWSKGPTRVDLAKLELYVERYLAFKSEHDLIDFADMLEKGMVNRPPVQVAIVDEAQDLSPLQISACYAWFGDCERVYVGGDDDQCQPDGTMVTLADGSTRDIKNLDPEKDLLQSYSRRDSAIYGSKRQRGYSFCKKTRHYNGPMIKISAAGRSTCCTLQHQWLTRFNDIAKQNNWTIVYLMRRGINWRVGWCQLFRSDGVFHPGHRARVEKADALWILKVFSSRPKASIEESFIAATYGIPTILFEPTKGTPHYTRTNLDNFWSRIGDLTVKAAACLGKHGLLIDRPIWDREVAHSKKGGAQIFKTAAANLLPGLMSLPYPDGRRVAWGSFEIVRRPYYGDVHSLDVEKYHTYIADGLATCNSIYMFAGADPQWMIDLQKVCTHYELLEKSYRVPEAVRLVANRIIQRNSRRVDKPYRSAKVGGRVECLTQTQAITATVEHIGHERWTTYVLVRNRMFAKRWVEDFLREGVPYLSEVGDKGPLGHARLVKAVLAVHKLLQGKDIDGVELRIILTFVPSGLFAPRGVKVKARAFNGHLSRMQLILEWNLAELLKRFEKLGPAMGLFKVRAEHLQYLDLVLKHLGTLPTDPKVRIMTIHGSKGREANTVIISSDMAKASWLEWQREEEGENRVAYVAVTRAKDELLICDPETSRFYPYWEFTT